MPDQRSRRVGGIIFDVGDILYDASQWRRWLTRALQDEGLALTYQELVERWEELLVDVYRGDASYWDRFDILILNFGLAEERAGAIRSDAQWMAEQVQKDRTPMPGVPETLRTLKNAGLKLGCLSDTESGGRKVRSILGRLGIERYFDAVVTSADIGAVKPDPKAYAAATAALGLELESCAFVGHDIDELEGARSAGLFAIGFNCPPDVPADVSLRHFSELAEVVLERTAREQESEG